MSEATENSKFTKQWENIWIGPGKTPQRYSTAVIQ